MSRKPFALLLAAVLVAGTMFTVKAEDSNPYLNEIEEYNADIEVSVEDNMGAHPEFGEARDFGPDSIERYNADLQFSPYSGWRREWHDRAGRGPGRGDWRGGHHGRGPGGPGGPGGPRFQGSQRGHGMMGRHRDFGFGFGPRGWDRIQLTPDQKNKILDVLSENYRARLEAKWELMEARRAIRELYKKDATPTAEAIVAANTALGTAQGKLDAQFHKLKQQMDGILTADQKQKLEEMRKAPPPRDKKGDKGKGPGGPGGPGPKR